MKIVIIILSVLAVLGVCCCGGIGAIFYVGLRDMTEEVKGKLADVPEIKEHIGDISSLRADLSASFNHEDDETFVYDIVGTKGNGQVHVKHITDGDSEEVLVSGQLILPDGETIPLTIPPILDY